MYVCTGGQLTDREAHALLHTSRHLGIAIVRDVWLRMESLVNTMTCILPNDAEAFGLDNAFNGVADLAIKYTRLANCDRGFQCRLRGSDELGGLVVDFADRIRRIEVSVEA